MSKPLPDRSCTTCGDTGRVERPTTADHILTDTKPWGLCPNGCVPLTEAEMREWARQRDLEMGIFRVA